MTPGKKKANLDRTNEGAVAGCTGDACSLSGRSAIEPDGDRPERQECLCRRRRSPCRLARDSTAKDGCRISNGVGGGCGPQVAECHAACSDSDRLASPGAAPPSIPAPTASPLSVRPDLSESSRVSDEAAPCATDLRSPAAAATQPGRLVLASSPRNAMPRLSLTHLHWHLGYREGRVS